MTRTQRDDRRDRRNQADPEKQKGKEGSLILTTSRFLEDLFSHRGAFWLGVVVALICFAGNVWFYYGLLWERAEMARIMAIAGGFLIAFGTTLFEILPTLWSRSPRNALNQIFVAGSKPEAIPHLNPKVVGDSDRLIADYRDSDSRTRDFFKMGRLIALCLEGFLGVAFLGTLGVGMRAIFSLVLFLASIFGCEWGVTLAVRSAQWELPPAIRKQFDEVLNNSGQRLAMKRPD